MRKGRGVVLKMRVRFGTDTQKDLADLTGIPWQQRHTHRSPGLHPCECPSHLHPVTANPEIRERKTKLSSPGIATSHDLQAL